MASAINWFEIPVADMDRAKAFYCNVLLADDLAMLNEGGSLMAFLPYSDGVGGALVKWDEMAYEPSHSGSVVYLNGGEDLSLPLSRVETAGGKILAEKMSIGENGFIAFFQDTEGNRVGFHSMA